MKIVTDKRINERRRCCRLEWPELQVVLEGYIKKQCELDDRAIIKIHVQQRTEGSPSYTVEAWDVTVETVEKY
jgi:hypothetical protein